MNCLKGIYRSGGLQVYRIRESSQRTPKFNLAAVRPNLRRKLSMRASSTFASSEEKSNFEDEADKSDTYSQDMTQAMGAVLTYRHELGMNYNFIRPDLIVGSCLQTPEDVDTLRDIGVKTIFCLQQNPDLEYFGVDIVAIQDYAKQFDDIVHYRAEIRDFDGFDLRMRLPAVVSKLYKAAKQNGGIAYIHCTAGLGRAPAVALAYMVWVLGYKLSEAHELLLSQRSCFPKIDAIKSATADMLTGVPTDDVTLSWTDEDNATVEISGLDIGWGQRIPLKYDEAKGIWNLKRTLPAGRYEYKYVVDEEWICNKDEPLTTPNGDGHVNNYVQVYGSGQTKETVEVRDRLSSPGMDLDLTEEERIKILQFLQACPE